MRPLERDRLQGGLSFFKTSTFTFGPKRDRAAGAGMRMAIVLLVFSMAMILAGLYLLVAEFLWASVIDVKVVLGATGLICIGYLPVVGRVHSARVWQ